MNLERKKAWAIFIGLLAFGIILFLGCRKSFLISCEAAASELSRQHALALTCAQSKLGCEPGPSAGSLLDSCRGKAFYFAAQTFSTVGYGVNAEEIGTAAMQDTAASWCLVGGCFFGVLISAIFMVIDKTIRFGRQSSAPSVQDGARF